MTHHGKANNIIVEGDGIGVYRDPYETNPNRRYKAIGLGCWLSPTLSFDGYTPNGHCGDLYDPPQPPSALLNGTNATNATFPLIRQFTGYIASSPDGLTWPAKTHVHKLSWPPPQKWDTHSNIFFDERTDRYVATTRDIPIYDTGVERVTSLTLSKGKLFEFEMFNTTEAPPIIQRGSQDHQTYAQVTFPWLDIYLGLSMVFDASSPDGKVHCRLVYALKAEGPWQAVGGDSILDAPDFLPLGGPSDFDSHIIFAAASPFRHREFFREEERIYYMGGNGPHSGARNSSFALATLRPDGFAGVRGNGTFRTHSLVVTHATLIATADFMGKGSALRIGVVPDGSDEPPMELSLKSSKPLATNATDAPMQFLGDCGGPDLTNWLGKTVQLEVSLEGDAMLYAIGFAPRNTSDSAC